ncbi:unnamed protein product, partial [Rotaria sp. Silwood2]
ALTNVFSTIAAMSKMTNSNIVTFQEEEQDQEKLPLTTENLKSMQKYETSLIRRMTDVAAESSLLQRMNNG